MAREVYEAFQTLKVRLIATDFENWQSEIKTTLKIDEIENQIENKRLSLGPQIVRRLTYFKDVLRALDWVHLELFSTFHYDLEGNVLEKSIVPNFHYPEGSDIQKVVRALQTLLDSPYILRGLTPDTVPSSTFYKDMLDVSLWVIRITIRQFDLTHDYRTAKVQYWSSPEASFLQFEKVPKTFQDIRYGTFSNKEEKDQWYERMRKKDTTFFKKPIGMLKAQTLMLNNYKLNEVIKLDTYGVFGQEKLAKEQEDHADIEDLLNKVADLSKRY